MSELPDDVQEMLAQVLTAVEFGHLPIATGKQIEILAQDNANLVSINAAHRLREDELEVKIEKLETVIESTRKHGETFGATNYRKGWRDAVRYIKQTLQKDD